jgi:hypothetical protein
MNASNQKKRPIPAAQEVTTTLVLLSALGMKWTLPNPQSEDLGRLGHSSLYTNRQMPPAQFNSIRVPAQ